MTILRTLLATTLVMQLGWAQGALAATTLDELLQQARRQNADELKANAEREAEFQTRRDQQARLLREAQKQRDELEQKSKELSARYDANDKEINQLNQILSQRQGNLGELFGVTRQVAGEVSTTLAQSMTGLQVGERDEFLRTMANTKALPTITELERLWVEMLREMTETSRVARFDSKVVQPDGSTRDMEVARVGPFIAMTEGQYVSYQPSLKQLALLPRQPPGEFLHAARDVMRAESGYVRAAVDPSRGVLLALYVERPNIIERIKRGEFVGYVIITVGVIGALLAIFQFFYLLRTRMAVRRQLQDLDRPVDDNPVGRVLLTFKGSPEHIEEDAEVVELRVSEAVLREVPQIERFQSFLRLAVAAGPLLGLIGTVIGMIITFQSITESGSSDPKLMAAGIGQAMIATVLGLGIAIPLLFANASLATLSRQIVQVLDEQSTGLLAEIIEKKKHG